MLLQERLLRPGGSAELSEGKVLQQFSGSMQPPGPWKGIGQAIIGQAFLPEEAKTPFAQHGHVLGHPGRRALPAGPDAQQRIQDPHVPFHD